MKIKGNLNFGIHLLLFIAFASCHKKMELAMPQSSTTEKSHYPSYNVSPAKPDATGMSSTAAQLAAQMNIGWNLGNTLEAIGGETAWGNPKVTGALITTITESGFTAVRIPCSWDQSADPSTAKIKSAWLSRVKEVVQYCIDNDMYVILNIHWDGGWLESNCTPEKNMMLAMTVGQPGTDS